MTEGRATDLIIFVSFLQNIRELCFVLLRETAHKIWAIFNWNLDWNIFNNKERSAAEAKGENSPAVLHQFRIHSIRIKCRFSDIVKSSRFGTRNPCLAVDPVASGSWLVLLPVSHGFAGWIGLHPQGDPGPSLRVTCPLPGAAQAALGSGCDLDHPGL